MRDRYRRILDTCEPYLVASPLGLIDEPGPNPLGMGMPAPRRYDPHRVESGPFLHVLQKLDELTFGPVGMTMPKWVFYDCAEVPGGIFGFSRPAAALPEWVLRALDVEDGYTGPVPLSMYVAIPMLEPGCWHTYTLCTVNEVAPGAGPAGLRQLTEALALEVLGIDVAYGATQWRSTKLGIHARFGPLELITAWTPAHSDPSTATFRFPVTEERIHGALAAQPPGPEPGSPDVRWVDCDEESELRAVQAELEAGRRLYIVGPQWVDGSFTRVPLREGEPT